MILIVAALLVGAAPDPSSHGYSGHGAESIAPEVLAKFAPKPIPPELQRRIQAMLDLAAPGFGRVSPDGKSLFYNWGVTGVAQVWKLDGPRRFPEQLTGGEDVTYVAAIVPDGSHLVIQRDRKGEDNPGLYLLDPKGGPLIEIQHLPGVQTQLQAISDDSRWLYFRSNDKRKDNYVIYRVDLKKQPLQKEAVFDQDGLWVIGDVENDGRMLLVKETGSISREIYERDPKTGALEPLFGQGESEEYDVDYGAHKGELIVRTNKMSEFRRLYSWTRQGGFKPLGEERKFDVNNHQLDRKRSRLLYQVNENGFTRLFAMDARTYKPIALPKLPDADHVVAGTTTPDGRYTTLGIDDGRLPFQAFVIDWKANKAERWHFPSTPEIDTTTFARAEARSYPARDGTPIPVLVRRPRSCGTSGPSAGCPVIVAFHGGPEGQAVPGFAVTPQIFVDRGFIYVEPNVRGSDGYGKTWFHADDGAKRLDVITDIEDAAKWARVEFAVNGRAPKLGVYGGSYGGYSVLMAMTRFAGAYDVGVDIVGISNLKTFLENTAPYRRILRISEYGDPEKDRDVLAKLSPTSYLDRVKAPIMIVAGASDPAVPAGESIQIYEALKSRNIPTDLVIFPDEGHGARKRQNRVLQIGYALAFFEKYLTAR